MGWETLKQTNNFANNIKHRKWDKETTMNRGTTKMKKTPNKIFQVKTYKAWYSLELHHSGFWGPITKSSICRSRYNRSQRQIRKFFNIVSCSQQWDFSISGNFIMLSNLLLFMRFHCRLRHFCNISHSRDS